jgi:hypothetical protein
MIRAIGTSLVLLAVLHFNGSIHECVAMLSMQMALTYFADYIASYFFAHSISRERGAKC